MQIGHLASSDPFRGCSGMLSKACGLFGPSQWTMLLAWAIGLLLGAAQNDRIAGAVALPGEGRDQQRWTIDIATCQQA
ncbi:hypothetical protein [Sphingomonas sp. 8AM]|uniref:hypothetical protein n=1 Tax=Sphingomonas sp. 8AM TaxID=2653170 RepID=UPI00135C94B4|nr:hypothetical protein [Sphingomonas sp. 8AM]